MTRKPWDPTPMNAILTLSLGGTYPAPPNTRRGTIESPIAAAPACPMNFRRDTAPVKGLGDRSLFFIVPSRPQLTVHVIWLLLTFCRGLPHFCPARYCELERP